MRPLTFLFLFNILLVSKLSSGLPDGMVSCAFGRYARSANYDEPLSDDDSDPLEDTVKFYLYTKQSSFPFQIFLDDPERLKNGNFDPSNPTKIIIHGYGSNLNSNSIVLTKEALFEAGSFNVIAVDWHKVQRWGKFLLPYPQIAKKVPKVARLVTKMIKFLEANGVSPDKTTLIGHSLGAHVAGIASYNLPQKVYRIIGLDPAAPYFEHKSAGSRLSKEDAKFVEVIHSEIDECGLKTQVGHYDFYPNSGRRQPGCDKYKCSHSRSYRFYAESINSPTGFHARLCEDWTSMQQGNCNGQTVLMGGLERTKPIPEGIYYVKTSDQPPYAIAPK